MQHGIELSTPWQQPLARCAERLYEAGAEVAAVNPLSRLHFPYWMREHVAVIANGSDPRRVAPLVDPQRLRRAAGLRPEEKLILFSGRLSEEKNCQAIVDCLPYLPREWRLVVLGPRNGPLERLSDRVCVLGPQAHVGGWLAAADVCCQPRHYESHCFAVNEAWLAGVPVVTGDTKVVERGKGDGIFITTAGIGVSVAGWKPCPSKVRPGDRILLTGTISLLTWCTT